MRLGFREYLERMRDVVGLLAEMDALKIQLDDARAERTWWQTLAVDAQLEAEQLKDIVKSLKARL